MNSSLRLVLLTVLAMLAFAGNSLLCRIALRDTAIDAATFTAVRIASGALMLAVILAGRRIRSATGGSWWAAAMLFFYAAFFSYAYRDLSAATGALLLFGAVQMTMTGYGLFRGERLGGLKLTGVLVALAGLVALLLPGLAAPPLLGAAFMILAGASWGVYSLLGKSLGEPTIATAGNFLRAVPFAAAADVLNGTAATVAPTVATGVLWGAATGWSAFGAVAAFHPYVTPYAFSEGLEPERIFFGASPLPMLWEHRDGLNKIIDPLRETLRSTSPELGRSK